MNWIEKVRYLLDRSENVADDDDFLYDICYTKNAWQPEEIDELITNYPWLPKSYIDFITEFDGISVAFARFYGSEKGDAISLSEIFIEEAGPCLAAGYFPFGRFPNGSNIIFNKDGYVLLWDKYDYEFEEAPKWLANSLEEFIGDCLLGKRFGEFDSIENNNYYDFLKSMNWA